MADTEKNVNQTQPAPQPEQQPAAAPQPESAEKKEDKKQKREGKAEAELAALKTQLEQTQKKLDETKDTLLRTAAGRCAGHAAFMGGSRVVLRHAVGVFFKSFVQNRWDAPPSV